MTEENARIHWIHLQKPTVVSQLYKKDGHNISWKITHTGRIGIRFCTEDEHPAIALYEEFSYNVNSTLPKIKIPQIHIDDVRETKYIGSVLPGLNSNCDEKEKLIQEITKIAADNLIADDGADHILWRLFVWAVQQDRSITHQLKRAYPEWAENTKQFFAKENR